MLADQEFKTKIFGQNKFGNPGKPKDTPSFKAGVAENSCKIEESLKE